MFFVTQALALISHQQNVTQRPATKHTRILHSLEKQLRAQSPYHDLATQSASKQKYIKLQFKK
jgi:hypothetical protein